MSKTTQSTSRSKFTDLQIVGQPVDISASNVLPTKLDVPRYLEWVGNQLKPEECCQVDKGEIVMRVIKPEQVYKKAPFLFHFQTSILMILKLHERCKKIKISSVCNTKKCQEI